MNPRLEKQLQSLAVIVACGATAGLVFNVPQGRSAIVGMSYGVTMSAVLGAVEIFILSGSLGDWLARFPLPVSLAIRTAIYAVIIAVLQWIQPGEHLMGLPRDDTTVTAT